MPQVTGTAKVVQIVARAKVSAAGGLAVNVANVFYFQRASTAPAYSAANVEAKFNTDIMSKMLLALNDRYIQTSNDVRSIMDATEAYTIVPRAGQGARVADSYDIRSAVYLYMKSGLRGKHYNGGKHFGPLNEEDTTGDILTGAGLTRWQAVGTAILAGFTDSDTNVWTPVVVSGYPLSQLEFNPTVVFTSQVTAVLTRKSVGTMRRRNPGAVY